MDIVKLTRNSKGILIRARLQKEEGVALQDGCSQCCVFSPGLLATPASVINTGARHCVVKYFLFPVSLRCNRFDEQKTEAFCGAILLQDKAYVVFRAASVDGGFAKTATEPLLLRE